MDGDLYEVMRVCGGNETDQAFDFNTSYGAVNSAHLRDFYQNNIQDKKSTAFGTDFLIQYSLRQTESDVDFQPVLVLANLMDDSVTSQADGVYRATFTLEKAGEYDL